MWRAGGKRQVKFSWFRSCGLVGRWSESGIRPALGGDGAFAAVGQGNVDRFGVELAALHGGLHFLAEEIDLGGGLGGWCIAGSELGQGSKEKNGANAGFHEC